MKLTKAERSWILYDVANSAFTMVLTATIPVFFAALVDNASIESVTNNFLVKTLFFKNAELALSGNLEAYAALKTSLFGLTTTVAVIIVAFIAPIIGAIADHKGMKKKMFSVSLLIGVSGLLSLGVTSDWFAYLYLIIIARIGYSAANIFYDSMLIDVSANDRMDYVSSMGYAWGYIGSCIPFTIGIFLILTTPFNLSTALATQISFILTALWWMLLTIPLLKNVKQNYYVDMPDNIIRSAFKRVFATLKKIKKDRRLLLFIIAYFCYIDGVYTIISMATTYGTEVGLEATGMIVALLVTQFVAFPSAILAGILAKKYGALSLIKIFIVIYGLICIYGYGLNTQFEFWVLAVSVGLVQGGIQSLSRAYYGKIIPKDESSEYFGFFDIFGKFADFFGPLLITISASMFGASKYGILALIILFAIGFVLIDRIAKVKTTS
ncbi:MAG: MFS transporter [Erysipelotrichaceae bacterium]|nr:MFS transporter [Erysipelotrichaceae bacterium]MDD4643091.1 MFS transporter [Erysipelotrichaceae bacterium]